MLIDLESLTGDGSEINFAAEKSDISPFALSRPSSLPLKERQSTFNPGLSSSPEIVAHRQRSYCSLPGTRLKPESNDFALFARPPSCIITTRASPYVIDVTEPKNKSCCWWITSRWQKIMGKSPTRRDVPVKCDVVRSKKSSPSAAFRRRAATAQPMSLFGKENKREWGEEHHSDVVYAVMLKKVKAPYPADSMSDGLQWETHKVKYIKGATLQYLVSHLCQSFVDDLGEINFLTVFLATYRSFSTPKEVLDLVVKETEKIKTEALERRSQTIRSIERVLRTWLDRYFNEDFYDPPDHPLLKVMQRLAEEYQNDEAFNTISIPPAQESDSTFAEFIKGKLSAAEIKQSQEEAYHSLNSPSHYSDILDETDNICVEEDSINLEPSKKFLQHLSTQLIAEQLTVKAANLFLRVVPYHCLNAVRSSKDKPPTVKATIDQFNRVVYCVLGTCLCSALKTSQRAKIICKWIEVAQECRELKNFSSLRAIISGLQTHSIHRLKRTWQQVPTAYVNLLQELQQLNTKDLIMKVGTAKVNTEKSAISRVRKDASTRRHQTITSGIMHGTVPYLGSFLTDLTYLHTAKPDFIEKGLINFNKRRKEFEQLAQLQLWQASCRSYQHLEVDVGFSDWFNSVTPPTDEQALQLSERIEPPNTFPTSPTPSTPMKRFNPEATSTHNGGSEASGSGITSLPASHTSSLSNDVADARPNDSEFAVEKENGHAISVVDGPSDEGRTINVQIIKKQEEKGASKKNMKLSSNDRSPAFMKKAFRLFDIDQPELHNFSLIQILPGDKELVIPETGNVFYAMNSSIKEYNFALVEKGAEIPREKQLKNTQTLPPPGKAKKSNRKNVMSTSSLASTSSPMKSIYRHLGVSAMMLSSGSYSPARAVEREDNQQEVKTDSNEYRVGNKTKKETKDDCALSIKLNNDPIGYSSDDNEEPRLKHKVWKFVQRGKGHRRNFSDSGQFRPKAFHIARPQQPHACHSTDNAVVLPVNMLPLSVASSRSHDDFRFPSSSSDGDIALEAASATWPRNFSEMPPEEPKLYRRAAIRKHHSHPREVGNYGKLTDYEVALNAAKLANQKSAERTRKSNTKPRFYMSYADDHGDSDALETHSSTESMEPVRVPLFEKTAVKIPSRKSLFERSASDPCILEYISCDEEHEEVFKDSVRPPAVTVQSPSPKRSMEESNEIPSDTRSPRSSTRRRKASETETTVL